MASYTEDIGSSWDNLQRLWRTCKQVCYWEAYRTSRYFP